MLWHFIPFLCFQLYAIGVYASVVDLPSYRLKTDITTSLYYQPIETVESYLLILSTLVYIFLGYSRLSNYRRYVADNFSDSRLATFNWLTRMNYLFTLLAVLLFGTAFMDAVFALHEVTKLHWHVLILYAAGLVYYFGFVGYIQPELELPTEEAVGNVEKVERMPPLQTEQLAQSLLQQLHIEKVYLEPELSAKQLAQRLDTSQKNLSYIINHQHNKSFRELINSLRIEEVKSRLLNNDAAKQSVLSISLESGFSSEASFYRVFKEHTGLSPKAFIASQQST